MASVMTSFPDSLQVPALGSADLQALRNDLARKVAEARSPGTDKTSAQPVSATLTRTANQAATYASSGSARVDLFFRYKGSDTLACTPSGQIDHLLHQAWQEDSTDTLRLMALLRDVRGGKGEQKLFHECAIWLLKHHPLTLISNLSEIVEVGYWKDLLEIVVRQSVSAKVLQQRAQQAVENKLIYAGKKSQGDKKRHRKDSKDAAWRDIPELKEMRKKSFRKHLKRLATDEERQQAKAERAEQTAKKQQLIADFVANQKMAKKVDNGENVIKKLSEDVVFQLLHLSVAVLFAEQLQKNLEALKMGKKSDVSLAAKWAPTPARSHDKDTLMAARIAEFLFPAHQHRSQDEAYSAYITRVKRMYHKQVLVPLRACLDVPEVYMSANAWTEVKYPRVPSVCMKNNKKSFEEHDRERFKEYLGEVRAGKKKIASGALKPHELVEQAMRHVGLAEVIDFMEEGEFAEMQSSALSLETMELQWKSYVSNLKASGTLSSALAVCDVSGSMSGQPMAVAIALSLLVAEVTAPPFNEIVCTFSAQPQLHAIQEGSLVSKVADLQNMEWGMNTDLNAVFTRILERALASNIPAEQMVETLFIFSDMQFDIATRANAAMMMRGSSDDSNDDDDDDDDDDGALAQTETNFKVAQAEFEKHGYKLPKIVFWNLQGDGNDSMPVTHNEQGVALVAGFSGQLLKLFMAGASELDKFDAFTIMKEAIAAERYNNWKVVD